MYGRAFKWMAAGLLGVSLSLVFVPVFENQSQRVDAIDPRVEANILKTTVQIWLFAPAAQPADIASEDGARQYMRAQGLGTLVVWQGEPVIVTHNHWGEMLKDAEFVHMLDAQGKRLVELGADGFKSLIRYSDPGTLVLDAPAGLSLATAPLGANQNITSGEIVTVARQDPAHPDQVDLLQARVVTYKNYKGMAVIELIVLDQGKLVPGDSGGGIWLHGKLVGNSWAASPNDWPLSLAEETSLAAPLPAGFFQESTDGSVSNIW